MLPSGRVAWAVIVDDEVVQSGTLEGSDPGGMRAYQFALDWAKVHRPHVSFQWKHLFASRPR